jgi:hypothetical protein
MDKRSAVNPIPLPLWGRRIENGKLKMENYGAPNLWAHIFVLLP